MSESLAVYNFSSQISQGSAVVHLRCKVINFTINTYNV